MRNMIMCAQLNNHVLLWRIFTQLNNLVLLWRKLTEKAMKQRMRTERNMIKLSPAGATKGIHFYIPARAMKVALECSKDEYRYPCKPLQVGGWCEWSSADQQTPHISLPVFHLFFFSFMFSFCFFLFIILVYIVFFLLLLVLLLLKLYTGCCTNIFSVSCSSCLFL